MSYTDRETQKARKLAEPLIGHKIRAIAMDDEFLRFTTEERDVWYRLDADCCSTSYFHDFVGVEKLLGAEHVLDMVYVPLDNLTEDEKEPDEYGYKDDLVQCYGYQIVSEHPQWGEVTSVFSFRNASNGYYGGSLELMEGVRDATEMPSITSDWVAD